MPRSMTPCSARTMNGTVRPSTRVVVRSTGRAVGDGSGFMVPSVARYDHVVFVGASHSGGLEGPSPAACVVHTHGWMCGPLNTGPSFGWFTTVSDTRDAPPLASIE